MTSGKNQSVRGRSIEVNSVQEALKFLLKNRTGVCLLDLSDVMGIGDMELSSPAGCDTGRLILISDTYDQHAREWVNILRPGAFLVRPVSDEQLRAAIELAAMGKSSKYKSSHARAEKIYPGLRLAEKLFNDTRVGVTLADPEGRVIYANKCFADLLGFTQEEIIGIMFQDLLSEKSVSKFIQEYDKRREGKIFGKYELTLKGNGNDPVPVVLTTMGMYSNSGAFLGSLARFSPRQTVKGGRRTSTPAEVDDSKRALGAILNSILPSLISMQSRDRLKRILDFMERYLGTDSVEPTWWRRLEKAGIPLTATEIALCAMIWSCLQSKQIWDIMGVTCKAISFHRGKLGKKIGLVDRKESLADFLNFASGPDM